MITMFSIVATIVYVITLLTLWSFNWTSFDIVLVGKEGVVVRLRKGGMLMFNSKGDKVKTSSLLTGMKTFPIVCSKGTRASGSTIMRGASKACPIAMCTKRLPGRMRSDLSLMILDPKIPASLPLMGDFCRRKLPM